MGNRESDFGRGAGEGQEYGQSKHSDTLKRPCLMLLNDNDTHRGANFEKHGFLANELL